MRGSKKTSLGVAGAITFFIIFTATALGVGKTPPAPSPLHPEKGGTPTPEGRIMSSPDWMTPPPPSNTQVGKGAQIYYLRCMACHGDQGQGLTLEWRSQWPEGEQNCSVNGCHGKRRPPDSFEIPGNFAPAIVGAGTLARFDTAQDVFDFVHARMPYQSPGVLSADEYWDLVAFLLNKHGVVSADVTITPANAASIAVHPPEIPASLPWVVGGIVVPLAVIVPGVVWFLKARRGRRQSG